MVSPEEMKEAVEAVKAHDKIWAEVSIYLRETDPPWNQCSISIPETPMPALEWGNLYKKWHESLQQMNQGQLRLGPSRPFNKAHIKERKFQLKKLINSHLYETMKKHNLAQIELPDPREMIPQHDWMAKFRTARSAIGRLVNEFKKDQHNQEDLAPSTKKKKPIDDQPPVANPKEEQEYRHRPFNHAEWRNRRYELRMLMKSPNYIAMKKHNLAQIEIPELNDLISQPEWMTKFHSALSAIDRVMELNNDQGYKNDLVTRIKDFKNDLVYQQLSSSWSDPPRTPDLKDTDLSAAYLSYKSWKGAYQQRYEEQQNLVNHSDDILAVKNSSLYQEYHRHYVDDEVQRVKTPDIARSKYEFSPLQY